VRRGADLEARSKHGDTLLLVQAAEAERLDAMQALLRLGADRQAKNHAGLTALDIARSREEDDKVDLLEAPAAGKRKKWWPWW